MEEVVFKNTFSPLMDQWFRYSLSMLGSKNDAEDIVQETLIKLWRKRAHLSGVKNLNAYSLQIVKNLCLDKLRKKEQKTISFNLNLHNTRIVNPEQQLQDKDELRQVLSLIDQLTTRQKEIFLLKEIEGLDYAEIATITQLEIGNIRAHLSMARKKIRALYKNC